MVFFHSFYLWISIRIFSFTTLEQVMGPRNKKFNEIKLFYIFFERNNYRKIHGLQVCLVLWSCVCFWELPRLKFERVESKGISSVCHVFASLNTNFVSLRPWQGAHGFSSRSDCKLGRTFTTQGFCAGTTFTPWIFFSLPISSKYIYEDSLSFIFVIAFSVVMIETKFRNLKGNSGAMENHVYTKDFFLSYLVLLPLNKKDDCYS